MIRQVTPGQTFTCSALADLIYDVFTTIRKPQPFMRLERTDPGDYYYYSFLNKIYTQSPLLIIDEHIKPALLKYPNMELKALKNSIDMAIAKFAEDNGFGMQLDRMKKNNKYSWSIVKNGD